MKKIEQIARIFVLVAALCFAVSIGFAAASSEATTDTAHVEAAAHGDAAAAGHDAVASEAHGEAAGEHGAVHGGSLAWPKVKDLLFRIMNFIALMIILVKFGAKPIASALSGRQQRVKDEIEDLEKRRSDAEKSYREFEAKLATVEQDIDSIVEKAVAQAEIEKARIIEKAEKAADDIQRQAHLAIQNEIMEARRNLKNEAADQATVMAEELIVKNLTPDDQVKIIEDYLSKVGAVQ